jgi:hypothetical protein
LLVQFGVSTKHTVEFLIEDEDGNALMVPSAAGDVPFRIATDLEVGRPIGTAPGTILLPIPPVPWTAGRRYVLVVRINAAEPDRIRFSVRPEPARPPSPPTPRG